MVSIVYLLTYLLTDSAFRLYLAYVTVFPNASLCISTEEFSCTVSSFYCATHRRIMGRHKCEVNYRLSVLPNAMRIHELLYCVLNLWQINLIDLMFAISVNHFICEVHE